MFDPTGMVSAMAYVEAFAVLGVHEVDNGRTSGPWFDGADLLLKTSDGTVVVCGLRTGNYVNGTPRSQRARVERRLCTVADHARSVDGAVLGLQHADVGRAVRSPLSGLDER